MARQNILYLCAVLLTLAVVVAVASFLVFPPRTFKVISRDGAPGPGLGPSGKGTSMSIQTWASSDGIKVEEYSVSYSSIDDACSDFELELSQAARIIESVNGSSSARIVAQFGPSYRSSYKVVLREQNVINHIEASHLEAVLAFEESWLKLDW